MKHALFIAWAMVLIGAGFVAAQTPVGSAQLVNDEAQGGWIPRIAMSGTGTVLVVWRGSFLVPPNSTTYESGLGGRLIGGTGVPTGLEHFYDSAFSTVSPPIQPSLEGAAGNFFLAWPTYDPDADLNSLGLMQISNSGIASLTRLVDLSVRPDAVTFDVNEDDGRIVLVFAGTIGLEDDVYAQILSPAFVPLTDAFTVGSNPYAWPYNRNGVSWLANGNVVFGWNNELHFFDDQGGFLHSVNLDIGEIREIHQGPNGNFYVFAWNYNTEPIGMAHLDVNGNVLATGSVSGPVNFDGHGPDFAVALADNGLIATAWSHDEDIFMGLFTPEGEQVGDFLQLTASWLTDRGFYHPDIAMSADGRDVFVSFAKQEGLLLIETVYVQKIENPCVVFSGGTQDVFLCEGDATTLSASPFGLEPFSYQWKKDGLDLVGATSASYPLTNAQLGDSGTYSLQVTDAEGCSSEQEVARIVVDQSGLALAVTISPDVDPSCTGDTITFTAVPQNEGSNPTYQWYVNGNMQSEGPEPTYSSSLFDDGDQVQCTLVADCAAGSPADSNTVTLSISGLMVPPPVAYADGAFPICQGASMSFYAEPAAGSGLDYQWYVNDAPVGSNSDIYTTTALNDGDQVFVEVRLSGEVCNWKPSNTVQAAVDPTGPVSVTIGIDPDFSATCTDSGATLKFVAEVVNAGSQDRIAWYVNGARVVEGPYDTAFSRAVSEGDVVHAIVTSVCASNGGAQSDDFVVNLADSDNDGFFDLCDNCPNRFNPNQDDVDGDGIGDACNESVDADRDGYADSLDNCPFTWNLDQADTDGDGVGDACNQADDADGDDFADSIDNCPALFNPEQRDIDGDGIGDACNDGVDSDGDDWSDDRDNCPDIFNPLQEDTDGDQVGDACNEGIDTDGDDYADDVDNCPLVFNPDQADADDDGVGDVCNDAVDSDADDYNDSVDNCPLIFNPDQVDSDGDGIGDACDTELFYLAVREWPQLSVADLVAYMVNW